MATLLTSVSTPPEEESCTSCSSGKSSEVPLEEGFTGGRGGSDGNAIGLENLDLRASGTPQPGGPVFTCCAQGYHGHPSTENGSFAINL